MTDQGKTQTQPEARGPEDPFIKAKFIDGMQMSDSKIELDRPFIHVEMLKGAVFRNMHIKGNARPPDPPPVVAPTAPTLSEKPKFWRMVWSETVRHSPGWLVASVAWCVKMVVRFSSPQ